MQLNQAYFANKVQAHLKDLGIDSTIDDAESCHVTVAGKTYEPRDEESPSRMAGRIKFAHITGADKLREVVAWIDCHREDFNDRFTSEQLVRLWCHGQLNDDRIAEFADAWSDAEIATALAAGCRGDAVGERVACLLELNIDDRLDLVWDEGEERRIVDVIIGGLFRPTRATWQKLIETGLPMCSWEEALEGWDQEAGSAEPKPTEDDGIQLRRIAEGGRHGVMAADVERWRRNGWLEPEGWKLTERGRKIALSTP